MKLPDDYRLVVFDDVRAFAVGSAVPWLRGTLAAGLTLAQWAEAQPGAERREGRGRVHVVEAPAEGPDGRSRWAVRHYWRGGAVAAPVLGDRYLSVGHPRPFRELAASHQARSRGIPTPAVVAGAVYPAGPFHRADLVTELIPEGSDLAEVLFGPREPSLDVAGPAMEAAGLLVRRLEEARIHHPDLNAKNVLLTGGDAAPDAHLLDLDGCRVLDVRALIAAGPMRRRLERSLRKFELRTRRRLDADAWLALQKGFGERI